MAKYYIQYNDLLAQAESFRNIAKTLGGFEDRLNSIVNAMDGRDGSMASLKRQARNCGKSMPVLENRVKSMEAALSEIKHIYLLSEENCYQNLNSTKMYPIFSATKVFSATKAIEGIASDINSNSDYTLSDIIFKDPLKTVLGLLEEYGKATSKDNDSDDGLDFFGVLNDVYGAISDFSKEEYYHGLVGTLEVIGKGLCNFVTGAKTVLGVKGTTAVSYVVDFFKNTYDNFNTEGNTTGRAVAETVGEGVVLVGTTCFAASASMWAAGLVTVGAPAVVVGAVATYAAKEALDWVVEGITAGEYDDAVEYISDTVIDTGKAVIDGAVGIANKVVSGVGTIANWLFG